MTPMRIYDSIWFYMTHRRVYDYTQFYIILNDSMRVYDSI